MIVNILNEFLNNTDHNDINHVIAKFIKKHINEIPYMKIEDIANECFVSKGKVSGFCKKIGYENFSALKDDCLKEKQSKPIIAKRQEINLQKGYVNHLHDSLETIQMNLEKIDIKIINDLVNDIHKAKHIFLYGIAYSHLLCQYFQYECEVLNKEVIVMDEKLNRDYQMPPHSLLIVITIEGYAFVDNHRLLRKLKLYSAQKWCLSTDLISQEVIKEFNQSLLLSTYNTEIKDRRILLRYLLDVILGRYQYLYMKNK